jgi:hypothetical protein
MKDSWFIGDAQDFTTSVPDYPASAGWTLKYRLIPRVSGSAVELLSSPEGDNHRVVIASATSAGWTAGEYSCVAWVQNGSGEKHTVDPDVRNERGNTSLLVRLLPNPRTVAAYDGRSPARAALDAANAALAGYGSAAFSNVAEYSINGRSMRFREFRDQGEFLVYRSKLAAEVWREDDRALVAAGKPSKRFVYARCVRA